MNIRKTVFREEFDAILERALVLVDDETNQKKSVVIQIGRPYWSVPDLEGACPVFIAGLHDKRSDIKGVDPMNALENAMSFVNKLILANPQAKNLFWENGEKYEPTAS